MSRGSIAACSTITTSVRARRRRPTSCGRRCCVWPPASPPATPACGPSWPSGWSTSSTSNAQPSMRLLRLARPVRPRGQRRPRGDPLRRPRPRARRGPGGPQQQRLRHRLGGLGPGRRPPSARRLRRGRRARLEALRRQSDHPAPGRRRRLGPIRASPPRSRGCARCSTAATCGTRAAARNLQDPLTFRNLAQQQGAARDALEPRARPALRGAQRGAEQSRSC